MSHPGHAISYQPLFTTLQSIDVQALIDQAGDPWYNQTLIPVGDVLVRLGVMQGEFHWHKHDQQDEYFFVLDGCSASNSTAPTPLNSGRGRRSPSQPGCSTCLSCRHAVPYS